MICINKIYISALASFSLFFSHTRYPNQFSFPLLHPVPFPTLPTHPVSLQSFVFFFSNHFSARTRDAMGKTSRIYLITLHKPGCQLISSIANFSLQSMPYSKPLRFVSQIHLGFSPSSLVHRLGGGLWIKFSTFYTLLCKKKGGGIL